MKKIILSALVVSLAFAVKAQDIPERKTDRPGMMQGKKHRPGQGMDFKALNLTEDQKTKIKTENENFRKQMEDLKKNDQITVREWKTKMESLRKTHMESMKGVLTAEQKDKLAKQREELKTRHTEMEKRTGDRMKTELNLTADQSAKLDANRKANFEQMKKIRENSSLSEDQKREQMKQLHLKQKESLKSILTKEQLEKLKEKHKGHDGRKGKPDTDKAPNKTI